MKALKIVLLTLFSVIAILLVISFFLKSTFSVSRSIEVKAEPEVVFAYLADLKNMKEWSPWYRMDTTQKLSYEGQPGAVGSAMKWESQLKQLRNGSVTRMENQEGKGFVNLIKREGFDDELKDIWAVEPTSNGSRITWTLQGDLGDKPWMKYVTLMAENRIKEFMPGGLEEMKKRLEALPAAPEADSVKTIAGFEASIKMTNTIIAVSIRKKARIEEMDKEMNDMATRIYAFMSLNGLKQTAPLMTIFYDYDKQKGTTEFETTIPVDREVAGDGDISCKRLEPIKVLAVMYRGDYKNIESVYNDAFTYLDRYNMRGDKAPREVYITNKVTEKNPANWLTEIQFPVK